MADVSTLTGLTLGKHSGFQHLRAGEVLRLGFRKEIHDAKSEIPSEISSISECLQTGDSGAELDSLWVRGRRRWGFEFKLMLAPSLSRSAITALEPLELQKLLVVDAGDKMFPLQRKVTAIAATRLREDLR